VPHHRFMNRHESLRHWPKLHPAVVHTATYYDGAILQPERLGLELILDAEAANARAMALNYVSLGQEGKRQVVLNDQVKGKSLEVRPQILINAAGPWIDLVDQAVGCETRFIGGTKGSHLVLDHAELRKAIGDHEFFFENKDGRIVLIFPLYDRILVGTSDLAVDDPDAVFCTEEEVDYFLEMIRRVFPAINVSRSHIVFRFSGVRPLAASHSRTTGQITRDHEIQVLETAQTGLPFPIYALVGGKWTSWRAFSEQVTDKCLAHLGIPRKVSTRELSIGGGREYPTKAVDRKRILERITDNLNGSSESAEVLFERYGMGALAVSEFASAHGDGPLEAIPTFSRQEIAFMAAREKIVHLDDLLLRRSMLAMLGYVTRQGIVEAADVLAAVLDWDEGRRAIEVSRTLEILKDKHQVEL
jgi:glycerol-3-phosphate dehydrogenase